MGDNQTVASSTEGLWKTKNSRLKRNFECGFLCTAQWLSVGQRGRAVRRLRRLEGFALALPHDFPHHGTVYKYFQKWERSGIWRKIRTQRKIDRCNRAAKPSPQSVETTEKRGRYMDMMVVKK